MITNKTLKIILKAKDELITTQAIVIEDHKLSIKLLQETVQAMKEELLKRGEILPPLNPNKVDISDFASLFEEIEDVREFIDRRTEDKNSEQVQEA